MIRFLSICSGIEAASQAWGPLGWQAVGFPDDYTLIPWRGKSADLCPDGPRYKALGNSMAVPVMKWIGARLCAYLRYSEELSVPKATP